MQNTLSFAKILKNIYNRKKMSIFAKIIIHIGGGVPHFLAIINKKDDGNDRNVINKYFYLK